MEQWKKKIAAMVPYYDAHGSNATLIYTTEGTLEQDPRTVKWNLRRLARLYCIDLEAARLRYGSYLECGQGVPIPFTPELVLVPLKVRRVVGKNDGSSGYFNPAAIEVVPESSADGVRSALIFPGGQRLPCYYTARTVKKRLKAGCFVLECYAKGIKPGANPVKEGANLPPDYERFLERLLITVLREADIHQ